MCLSVSVCASTAPAENKRGRLTPWNCSCRWVRAAICGCWGSNSKKSSKQLNCRTSSLPLVSEFAFCCCDKILMKTSFGEESVWFTGYSSSSVGVYWFAQSASLCSHLPGVHCLQASLIEAFALLILSHSRSL